MYAVLQQGGHQYRVTTGDHVLVDRVDAEVGETLELEPVLLFSDGNSVASGQATKGARVVATVIAHRRGPKLRVFKYKPKKRYRRSRGFRAMLTELQVEALLKAGEKFTKKEAPAEKPKVKAEEVAVKAETKTDTKALVKTTAVKKAPAKRATKKEEE